MVHRLREDEIASVLCGLSDDLSDMALELRRLVLTLGPDLDEQIAFHALCYSVPGRPYGSIGGNVCLIGHKRGCLQLAFLHGVHLPDPLGLLQGTGKAKRHIEWSAGCELRADQLEPLIRAAIAYDPSAG
jgi:hypothetical protein